MSPLSLVTVARSPKATVASARLTSMLETARATEIRPPESSRALSRATMSLNASTSSRATPADGSSACTTASAPTPAVVACVMLVRLDAAGRSMTPPEPESTLKPAVSPLADPIQSLRLVLAAAMRISLPDTRPPAPTAAFTVLSTAFAALAPLAPTTDALTLSTVAL